MSQLDINMLLKDGSTNEFDDAKLHKAINDYNIGSFLNSPFSGDAYGGFTADQWRSFVDTIQNFTMTQSRLKIPMIYGLDSVHGANYVIGSTLFPHNFGVAASYNLDLARQAATINAKDTAAAGIKWAFTPVLGLAIQPLWPRFYETFGEDTYTITQFAKAITEGSQDPANYAEAPGTACAKHYMGYPAPRNGKDRTDAWIPEHYVRQYFLPPFQQAFSSGIGTLMVNSASINGIPTHADGYYLDILLRQQLGFEGVAVTDWQDIEKLHSYHRMAATDQEAVKLAVDAGIDMSMIPSDFTFCDIMFDLVNKSVITESRVDDSVRRVLKLKRNIGLFENPYSNASISKYFPVGSDSDRLVALNLARESITLLKNEKISSSNPTPVLPLTWLKDNASILVVGPSGNSLKNLCGGWSIHWQGALSDSEFKFGSTIFGALKQFVPSGATVTYTQGCTFTDANANDLTAAAKLASTADVVILAVGEAPEAESLGNINDLTISESQLQLFDALFSTGKPIVTVLIEPRPRVLNKIGFNSTAILMGYLPCLEGGQAIAEILMGKTVPSGKLPFTYPRTTGDIDVYFHKPWGTYSQGTDMSFHTPLFDFGAGLSYTSFSYSNLAVSSQTIGLKDALTVTVTVKNTGQVDAKETVHLFVSQIYRSRVTPEQKMLKRFTKIFVKAGTSEQVSFKLTPSDLSYIDPHQNTEIIEGGAYTIAVADQTVSFTLDTSSNLEW